MGTWLRGPLVMQGGDVGTQYRSGIYWHTLEQREIAQAAVEYMQDELGVRLPIITPAVFDILTSETGVIVRQGHPP